MQKNLSLSIDIGGTSAKYAYVTADGKLTGKDSFPTSGLKTWMNSISCCCLLSIRLLPAAP